MQPLKMTYHVELKKCSCEPEHEFSEYLWGKCRIGGCRQKNEFGRCFWGNAELVDADLDGGGSEHHVMAQGPHFWHVIPHNPADSG